MTLTAQGVYNTLKNLGVTHLIWLPDTESGHMWDEMASQGAIKLVQVTREGEALGIAAGLIATGKNPVVLIQNTGLFESGDSLRGLGIEAEMPILLMVGYRGYEEDSR